MPSLNIKRSTGWQQIDVLEFLKLRTSTEAAIDDDRDVVNKAYLDKKIQESGGVFVANSVITNPDGTTTPYVPPEENRAKLWIDTNPTAGGLKYYNGTNWVYVPVAFS